jgi:UDP-N-acetylglucosamine:LPS N-acetylglucosamine transferase
MAKVLIVTLAAGGGHKTAMFSIARALQTFAPHIEVECFESSAQVLDSVHRSIYTKAEMFYDLLYRSADNDTLREFYSLFTQPVRKQLAVELRPLMQDAETEVIISTHFLQTYALQELKHELNSSVRIISYVPDFDESLVHFTPHRGLRPDGVIAQSPRFLAKLRLKYGLSRYATQRAGFITREEFTNIRTVSSVEARIQITQFDTPLAHLVKTDALTFIAAGGTYWVSEILGDIRKLAASDNFNWKGAQILVACGHNDEAFAQYSELQREASAINPDVRIVPMPFLDYQQMATLYRASDVVILSGIAPATLYELLEAQAGLPIIRRINPGPERYNLKYIRARNLGAYTPDKAEFIRSLEELSYNLERVIEQNATFRTRAEKERSAALKRTEEMAYFVERMAVDEEFATMLPTSGVSHRAQAGFRPFQPSTRPLLTTLLNRSTPRVKHKRTVLEKVPAEKQE